MKLTKGTEIIYIQFGNEWVVNLYNVLIIEEFFL